MMAIAFVVGFLCPSFSHAAGEDSKPNFRYSAENLFTKDINYYLVSENYVIRPNSLTTSIAPIPGAIKGKVSYKSRYGNYSDIADLVSAISFVSGASKKNILGDLASKFGTATFILDKLGIGNLYYTSTHYTTKNSEFYWRYDYYTDSSYSDHIYTNYSEVFGLGAK